MLREGTGGFWRLMTIYREGDSGGAGGAGGGTPPPADNKAAPAAAAPPAGDQSGAGGQGTPATPPAADAQGTPPPAGTPPADAGKPAAPDWTQRREAMISTLPQDVREKASKVLGKYATEDAMVLALASADSKITELSEKAKGLLKVPGADAKPEEIDAFHKAIGVPETADKYVFNRGDDYQPSELDKVFDAKAKEILKKTGVPQSTVDAIVKLDEMRQQMAHDEMLARVKQSATKAADELRVAWGVNEYAPQVEAIQRYVKEVVQPIVGGDADTSFLDRRFADGTCLGEDPAFLKFMAQHVVNPWMDDNGIPRGNVGGGNAQQDSAREAEIMKLMHDEPKRYASKEIQDELDQILTRKAARNRQKAA